MLNVSINVIKTVHSNKHFSEKEQFSISCQPDWSCELLFNTHKKKKGGEREWKTVSLLSFQRHFLQAYSYVCYYGVLIRCDDILVWEGAYLKSVVFYWCFFSW